MSTSMLGQALTPADMRGACQLASVTGITTFLPWNGNCLAPKDNPRVLVRNHDIIVCCAMQRFDSEFSGSRTAVMFSIICIIWFIEVVM